VRWVDTSWMFLPISSHGAAEYSHADAAGSRPLSHESARPELCVWRATRGYPPETGLVQDDTEREAERDRVPEIHVRAAQVGGARIEAVETGAAQVRLGQHDAAGARPA
jgi:hypothetical protein